MVDRIWSQGQSLYVSITQEGGGYFVFFWWHLYYRLPYVHRLKYLFLLHLSPSWGVLYMSFGSICSLYHVYIFALNLYLYYVFTRVVMWYLIFLFALSSSGSIEKVAKQNGQNLFQGIVKSISVLIMFQLLVWKVSRPCFVFLYLFICVFVYLFMGTCLLFLWRISLLIRFHSCLLYLAAASHCKAAAE